MCLAAAAVAAAAAIASHCWVLSSVRDEASRVFHIKNFFPFEKSICRYNLLAQSGIQLWHETLSARIAVLCLVLGLYLSSRRRPDYFPLAAIFLPLLFSSSSDET